MEKLNVFKCSVCGNMVEVLAVGGGTLTCCGEAMEQLEEKTQDAATEKHVPIIEATDKGIKVIVGSTAHPMEEQHFIQWIEAVRGETVCRAYLKPGQAPEAEFAMPEDGVSAREYCNVHGLWKS